LGRQEGCSNCVDHIFINRKKWLDVGHALDVLRAVVLTGCNSHSMWKTIEVPVEKLLPAESHMWQKPEVLHVWILYPLHALSCSFN